MGKEMVMVRPNRGATRRFLLLGGLLLSLVLSFPLTARADDDGKKPLHVEAFVAVTDGGVARREGKSNIWRTRGEQLMGCITNSDWDIIMGSAGCSPFGGPDLKVDHSSTTRVMPSSTPIGQITGRGNGSFSRLGTSLSGRYNANISAQYLVAKGFPLGMVHVADTGTWTMADRKGNVAKGTFRLELFPYPPGAPITLAGTLTLDGVHWADD